MSKLFDKFFKLIDANCPPVDQEAHIALMLGEVNAARALDGKPPVNIALIEKADSCASGHIDYCRKFARYCEELVDDTGPNEFWYI